MTLHPDIKSMLDKAAKFPPMHQLPLAKVRELAPRMFATGVPPQPVGSVLDETVDAGERKLRVRAYRPAGAGCWPLTMFFHGSGFTICSIETHDAMCRRICNGARTIVVSVDYGLAPERPFPSGPDDCLAATLWAAENARRLGANGDGLGLCGDSAGGCMAATVAFRLRKSASPRAAALAMIYPVTDHFSSGHASYGERGQGLGLEAGDMRWFWNFYLPDPSSADDPLASPLRASSLEGMPPAFIATAEFDVLRDEGRLYAQKLAAAGAPVTYKHYGDMNHGFLNLTGLVDRADEAMADLTGWLAKALRNGG
jgi:acetyl esterase